MLSSEGILPYQVLDRLFLGSRRVASFTELGSRGGGGRRESRNGPVMNMRRRPNLSKSFVASAREVVPRGGACKTQNPQEDTGASLVGKGICLCSCVRRSRRSRLITVIKTCLCWCPNLHRQWELSMKAPTRGKKMDKKKQKLLSKGDDGGGKISKWRGQKKGEWVSSSVWWILEKNWEWAKIWQ